MGHSDRCGVCRRRGMRKVVYLPEAGQRVGDIMCLCGVVVHPPEQKRKKMEEEE